MREIRFEFGSIALEAELFQTPTANAIWDKLPIRAEVLRQGEEVYFEVPVAVKRESGARAVVEHGEIAYWPDGFGAPQHHVHAHIWFNFAGLPGDFKAAGERDKVAANMTSDQIAEAERLAREWKPTKQQRGHSPRKSIPGPQSR